MNAKPIRKPDVQPAANQWIDQGRRNPPPSPELRNVVVWAVAIALGVPSLVWAIATAISR